MAETQAYCTAADVNVFLDSDVLTVDDPLDNELAQEAVNIIHGRLYGHIPVAVMQSWDSAVDNVPQIIQSIAGRLVAAIILMRRLQSTLPSSDDIDPYAQRLYQTAVGDLNMIIDGQIVVPELVAASVEIEAGGHVHSEDYFYPRDSSPPPKFAMDMEL